ncbi:uncharacterized protein BDV14DRAFT_184845 [Aspergillus stella-maris]|uniref:uncharacterized protein n=1 Tax=Aspergillus stella-maris TaxID=1810926 RepID=UPI003CCC98AB
MRIARNSSNIAMTATSDSPSETTINTNIAITMGPRTLPAFFSSLARSSTTGAPKRWTLLRNLKSENVNDLTGDLHGTATLAPLPPYSVSTQNQTHDQAQGHQDLLYSEEGSLPASFGPGLRWTKKYIWRLSPSGKISVWFVKVDKNYTDGEEEADYLFHEFNVDSAISTSDDLDTFDVSASVAAIEASGVNMEQFVVAPVPPPASGTASTRTRVISARGNHLCIDDMYRTAYSFRIDERSGEVLSWASRHVVKGPKKGQDIVNFYTRAE